jgi:predicted DNA-binding transcriptional regulator AlpA
MALAIPAGGGLKAPEPQLAGELFCFWALRQQEGHMPRKKEKIVGLPTASITPSAVEAAPFTERLLTLKEVMEMTGGLSWPTIRRRMANGTFPMMLDQGHRPVWLLSVILQYMRSLQPRAMTPPSKPNLDTLRSAP